MPGTREISLFKHPALSSGGCFFVLTAVLLLLVAAAEVAGRQESEALVSRPVDVVQPFQPGVRIDWQNQAVHVSSHVVLREGPIEFLACFAGKEHESVVRLDASATHIFMAMGLVGLEPGRPPRWNESEYKYEPPSGALVDVEIAWVDGEGQHSVDGFSWLLDQEYGRAPVPRPWIFSGSRKRPDGVLGADLSGAGISVVDKPDSLLSLSRGHVDRNSELWVSANTTAIPDLHTPVLIILRPAALRTHQVSVDWRGAVFVDGRFAQGADLADLVGLARRLRPDYVQVIELENTLRCDVRRLQKTLVESGLPLEAFEFVKRPKR